MPETRIFEGKTTNEAIEKGLKELKVSKNDVEIKVIENDEKRSFFNILTPRVVKIEMKLKEKKEEVISSPKEEKEIDRKVLENAEKRVKEFLDNFLKKTTGKDVEYKCNIEDNVIRIVIDDKDTDFLIGYRGETLNAIQTIISAYVSSTLHSRVKAVIDINRYKEKRKVILEDLAVKMANKAIKTGRNVTLEPMQPYERKIIHSKLQNNNRVRTHSIGENQNRRVVIELK